MLASITHLALYTTDLERSRAFYMKYFSAESNQKYVSERGNGFCSYFLTFSSGARLEIMSRPDLTPVVPKELNTGWSHLAFAVGNAQNVISLTEQMRQDGVTVVLAPHSTGDGYFESTVLDPDGNCVEITQ